MEFVLMRFLRNHLIIKYKRKGKKYAKYVIRSKKIMRQQFWNSLTIYCFASMVTAHLQSQKNRKRSLKKLSLLLTQKKNYAVEV